MEFMINGHKWEIEELDGEMLKRIYEKENGEGCLFAFGLTNYAVHVIYLNADMCTEQKKKTLLHELTHCYMWEMGINLESYTEEDVCNISSGCNEVVNAISKEYFMN